MGVGDFLAFLEVLLEHRDYVALIVSAVLLLPVMGCLMRWCTSRWYRVRIGIAGLSALCIVAGIQFENRDVACCAYIVLIVTTVVAVAHYQGQDQMLETVARYNDQHNVTRNPSTALSLLRDIRQDELVGAQVERYERYKVYTYIALGNNRVAKELLESEETEGLMSPAFRHFFLHIIADQAANREESQNQLSKATAHKDDAGTDALTILQLEHNQAVLHVNKGQHQVALNELDKVIARTSELGVTNKDFLNIVYHNYVLVLALVGLPDGGASRGWEAIDRYASSLDPSDPADVLALFNLKLYFMRQLGMASAQKNELCHAALRGLVENPRFTEQQKVVGVASLGKICWSDGLDPLPMVAYLADNADVLVALESADRYACCSNLRQFLPLLDGIASETIERRVADSAVSHLSSLVAGYMQNAALYDLESWERSLPSEAYLARAHLLRERAALHFDSGDDKLAAECMEEAIGLLEDNMLVLEAMELRLRLAKTLVVQDPDRALGQVRHVEQSADGMRGDPSLGYVYANIALCYALANRRDDCLRTYALASQHKVPMSHFDPHDRAGMAVAAFCARFFLFARAMEDLKGGRGARALSESATGWVSSYPKVWGPAAVILLARFLGYEGGVPIARRCLLALDRSHFMAHYWLEFLEVGVVFDPTIRDERDGMVGNVFTLDSYPMIAMGESERRAHIREGYAVEEVERVICTEAMLDPATRSVIEEVGSALELLTASDVPSKRELMDAYMGGVASVAVPVA